MASKQSLSECCRKHGLPVTGNKDELLERLLGEEHILKAVLDAKPSKKEKEKKTSPLLKKTIGKKDAYEQFCDKTRPLLIAGGMTDGAQISRKLAEMYTSGNKKPVVSVTSHVGHVSQMPPEVLAAIGLSHQPAAPPVAPPAPRGPIFDPATIPDNMVLSMSKIPDQFVSQAGMQLVSEGNVTSGQQAWLYLKNSVGLSSGVASLPAATAMPAPPAPRPPPPAPPSPASSSSSGGLFSQSEATLRASLMALGLPIDGDKNALVERLMRACGPTM